MLLSFLFSGDTRLSFGFLFVVFYSRHRSSVAKSADAKQHSMREGWSPPLFP